MKLFDFLHTARKEGADISKIFLRIKDWPGPWAVGVNLVSLKGNRMTIRVRATGQEVKLQPGHPVLKCLVRKLSKPSFKLNKLTDDVPAMVIDLVQPVAV